jgi:integrase
MVNTRMTYQYGSLIRKERKKGPDVWVFRYRQDMGHGTRKHRSVMVGTVQEFPTLASAEKAAEVLRINANPDNPAEVKVTLRGVAERYKQDEYPALRHSTQLATTSYLGFHILPKWGDYTFDRIKSFAVETWLKGLSLAPSTKRNILNVISLLFTSAMRWEFIEIRENPMKLVRVRGCSKRIKEPRVLTMEEVGAWLRELDEPYSTMVFVAAASGLRCSELFALKWCDFDWEQEVMHVRRAIVDGVVSETKTEYSRSKLPLHPAAIMRLQNQRAESRFRGDEDFVFASWRTNGTLPYRPTAVLEDYLKPAADRAGLGRNVGWHTLRRTYSTLLRANGEDIKVQQALLRHADIKTTLNLYTFPVPEQMRAANSRLVEQMLAV